MRKREDEEKRETRRGGFRKRERPLGFEGEKNNYCSVYYIAPAVLTKKFILTKQSRGKLSGSASGRQQSASAALAWPSPFGPCS
jgi:hypothetical protein